MCENCSHYLGPLPSSPPITECEDCKSTKVNDVFIEYNLKQLIKDAFEVRDLKNLIEIHSKENENNNDSFICDFTSGSKYKMFKQEAIKNEYDVCLLWNTDGAPVSKSSNGQIWPIQVKIMNISPGKRRGYQFLTGLYYTHETKPPMNSFLKPFTDALKDLYENGIEWFDKSTQTMKHSTVIAPIATLDCPARATVQNLMRCNGENGCTTCEHPGMTCPTGSGHARVYPFLNEDISLRTKERMLEQANLTVSNGLRHVKGVKGAAIAATIPFFDWATSFVSDYMHAILLGVARMLFNLWFDGANSNKPFYIKKKQRDEIDHEIKKISPPDFIVRTPRQLKDRNYWKASEIRDFLLFYFPILLKDKLPTKYYKHFLLLVYGTRILLQEKIHVHEINTAESLLDNFTVNILQLYGLEKCTYNVHQLTHMAQQVRMWGPLWTWSAFSFEDGIGYYKKLNHGPNKVDVEIANTLKIFNAYYILKDKLHLRMSNENVTNPEKVLGVPKKYNLNEHELEALLSIDFSQESYIFPGNFAYVYNRAIIGRKKITSKLYTRQKKRTNSMVSWNNNLQFGIIQFFIRINTTIVAVIREYIRCVNETYMIHPEIRLNLNDIIIPMRLTYCYHALPLSMIEDTILYVNNYVCIPPNCYEKK